MFSYESIFLSVNTFNSNIKENIRVFSIFSFTVLYDLTNDTSDIWWLKVVGNEKVGGSRR
jgi:hypothetical protein